MTVEQVNQIEALRAALTTVETQFSAALDAEELGLAQTLQFERDRLWNELVRAIQAADPYTTEADIRYFEGR